MGSSCAKEIRQQASQVLSRLALVETMESFGQVFFTGSYALDLMTWNDIDLQLKLKEGKDPVESLMAIFASLARSPHFIKGKVIHFKGDYKPHMPRGHYLGVNLNVPDLGGEWKLDLWILAEKDFHSNSTLVEQLSERLTPEKREHILRVKRRLMGQTGRVPQMGSHYLYQAVLLEQLEDDESINSYLRKRGVDC